MKYAIIKHTARGFVRVAVARREEAVDNTAAKMLGWATLNVIEDQEFERGYCFVRDIFLARRYSWKIFEDYDKW